MPSRLLSARWSATMPVMRMIAAVVIGGVLALSQSGCSGAESGGLCPLSMNCNGETHYALKTEGLVQGQQPIADVGFACLTNDEAGREDAKARFPAESIEGVDPKVAFVVPSRWPGLPPRSATTRVTSPCASGSIM